MSPTDEVWKSAAVTGSQPVHRTDCDCWECLNARLAAAEQTIRERDAQIAGEELSHVKTAEKLDAALAFKKWVHNYLDGMGIPTHPDGPHSKEGCRVGDRMDIVAATIRELREQLDVSGDSGADGERHSIYAALKNCRTYEDFVEVRDEVGATLAATEPDTKQENVDE